MINNLSNRSLLALAKRVAAISAAIVCLTLSSVTFPAQAATETGTGATSTIDGTTNGSVATVKGENDSIKTEVPQLNSEGIPYLETAQAAPVISQALALQLAESGELETAYIDDTMRVTALITKGGVILTLAYDKSPEFLQTMFDAGIIPTFISFESAPVTELQRIAKEKEKFDWSPVLMMLPILIMISGTIIIFEIRNYKLRKPEASPDETAYQTREGPAGTIPTVTFADVAGCEEAIEDLSEIVNFLKNPDKYERLGAKIPRGALLVGPPGTGKTLLARAVAGEAKVAFFSASGSDFVEMYVGVGPARVRELFTKARAAEKAIIFIDEIDAVARSRAMSTKQNANDERENTLNALLHELDGFSRSNVILLAATNRVDILDPAVIRPGRLDRKIQVPNPDRRGREKILGVHVTDKPLAKDVDLGAIARRTPGMSGADLAQIANEAAIEAARRGRKSINAECFSAAVALVAMGRARKSALITDRDRLITAYHEAGHTVCALVHPGAANPAGVSITPRGHAGGITWMNGTDDLYLSRPQASAQLVVALGGRAGEELLLDGEFTQGPSSDLERATQLATVMVTKYGMTRRGLAVRGGDPDNVSHDVIEELLAQALDSAQQILVDNRELFMAIVNQLLEHDTLESADLDDIIATLNLTDHPTLGSTGNPLTHVGHVAVDAAHAVGSAVTKVTRTALRAAKKSSPAVEDAPQSETKPNRKSAPADKKVTVQSNAKPAPASKSSKSDAKPRKRKTGKGPEKATA